ncbi:hypothetical protein BJX63DRAFT_113400 [Aspergillus granulosus]|uniref:Uncharacterized protein n=1 Tax=Aspergillus granulosus TaxID=176169 RepID=A0ABR4HPL4_9EURO
MDGAINVVYQHRDKHLHRVLIDLETGHSLADTTLRNSRFDEPIVDIMIKEGEDGGFSIYAPLVDRERQEQLDELFKKNPELLNGDKPRAIDGLVAITADGERTELEEERQRIDPNARTMPVGLQTRLIPKQPGAAASSIRAA